MGTSASFARKALLCLAAALLAFTLVPTSAFAQEEAEQPQSAVDSQVGDSQEVSAEQVDKDSGSTPAASAAEGGTLASALVGAPTAFINSDVALDGEPVIGSFTVDGMTFAVTEGSDVELVGVSSDRQQVTSSQEGDGSPVAPMLASGPDESNAGSLALAIPESISYEGVDYAVTSIGAYAFYLSGVTDVELPASIAQVDDRAFRSSDVASATVADGNATYSSFDGALYSADYSSLLLIPEGKQGTVLLPKRAEVADAGKFSHCSLASAIAVEEGSAAFASENGLLYTSDLTTLLRVPAGATDITIRDGCTTIAAGALEACASLETITAPASVTSISPDVFTSVPTISLPATALVENAPQQLTAVIALSSVDDSAFNPDTAAVMVHAPSEATAVWHESGFEVVEMDASMLSSAATSRAGVVTIDPNGGSILGYYTTPSNANPTDDMNAAWPLSSASWVGFSQGAWSGGSCYLMRNDTNIIYLRYCSYNGIYAVGFSASPQGGPQTSTGWTIPDSNAYYYAVYPATSFILDVQDGLGSTQGSVGVRVANDLPSITMPTRSGYTFEGYYSGVNGSGTKYYANGGTAGVGVRKWDSVSIDRLYANWSPNRYSISFDAQGGQEVGAIDAAYDADVILPSSTRAGYAFRSWNTRPDGSGVSYEADVALKKPNMTTGDPITLYAQWERVDFDLGFDVGSEPGDEDYPGVEKPDETVNVESGPTVIEDPKRPGYVFQGWTIPNAEGTEAIDQDLVYQDEADGKWYVDASKLPDYANDEGRVELTARWTSVISVDVPSAVTFYADVVTEGQESREGAASSAFGQNKVASQSEVDLRIVELESTAVATEGNTLGADSILKKSASATPSSSSQKLFSLYPTDKALTPDDLQDPDAVSTTKPSDAVDFALDDLLLEKSFAADSFTIPAGDTLNLGYRLNLAETGTELDYDTLSTLDEGTSASIANISYCFGLGEPQVPDPTGSEDDPLYIEVTREFLIENGLLGYARPGIYGLDDIKAAADDLSANTSSPSDSAFYHFCKTLLDAQVMDNGNPGTGPYFQLRVAGASGGYLDLQLIGICQDTKADGSKAGLTFQVRDIYAYDNKQSAAAGSAAFSSYVNTTNSNSGGWLDSALRATLRTTFMGYLDPALQSVIATVRKNQQLYGGTTASQLQSTTETIFLPSMYEVFGTAFEYYNDSERYAKDGYAPFQYLAYQGNDGSTTNAKAVKKYNGSASRWWLLSSYRNGNDHFCGVQSSMNGLRNASTASSAYGVAPCFAL